MSSQFSSPSSPVYFWKPEEVPYGFLSQWYAFAFTAPSPIASEPDMTFVTTEQYMMYHKAILFNDHETAQKIMKTVKPAQQKALGRKVEGFTAKKWDAHKEKIVEEGNWWKFTSQKDEGALGKKLLETGERELVEASRFDWIWGIGFSAADAESTSREAWGENLLGKAIMRVRERMRAQEQQA
ncbi:hypothetical protein MMC30_001941 [Trapelia coarctata]|nr:hypothetical protein [Trapelia coarctata]